MVLQNDNIWARQKFHDVFFRRNICNFFDTFANSLICMYSVELPMGKSKFEKQSLLLRVRFKLLYIISAL